ncbi:hypothetical protein WMF30_51455 [Sorangium sp. So ce134]
MPNNDLTTARAELVDKLTDALKVGLDSSEVPAPLIHVDAPGGLGKSHITAQLLRDRRVVWFGERKKLEGQLQDFLGTPLPGVTPLPPSPGTAPCLTPELEKRPSREDSGFCSQLDKRIKPLQSMGLGRFEQRMACKPCPDFKSCRYQNWRPSTRWLFATHARLGLRNRDEYLFKWREIAVIDESPVKEILQAVTLKKHEIVELLTAVRDFEGSRLCTSAAQVFTKLFDVVLDLLADPPPGRRRVELRVLLRDLGYRFIDNLPTAAEQLQAAGKLVREQPEADERDARRAKDAVDGIQEIDPMATAYLIQELQLSKGLSEKLHKLADALAADTGARPTCVVVLPSTEGKGGIAAGQLVVPPIPPNMPVVLLDATSDPIIPLHLFPGRPIIDVRVSVQQTARILQTLDHRYPDRTLMDPKSPAIDRLMGIVDMHKLNNPTHKVAMVVKRQLFNGQPHVKNRILKSVAEDDIMFFWANRGDNSIKDYDALFVLGAPELPALEIEARARAFMSQIRPEPNEQPFDYRVVPQQGDPSEGYVTATNGTRIADRGYLQGGPMFVFYAFHQAEYAQAMLRLRPYDPTRAKTIVFFSNIDIPFFNMEFTTESDLLGQAPALLVRACDVLKLQRAAGIQGAIMQKDLAQLLGVSKAAITKAKKKYGHTALWREIESLMTPRTGVSAQSSTVP